MPLNPQVLPRRARRPGFTLIELLTVISVVAILASILIPVISKASEYRKKAQSLSLFGNIENAFESYLVEYNHYPIFPELNASTTISTTNGEKDYTFMLANDKNLLRQVLVPDNNYLELVKAPGQVNYNIKAKSFLTLSDFMTSATAEGGSVSNPVIVDGFGNPEIAIVVHVGNSKTIDSAAFKQEVHDPDGGNPMRPSVVRSLPQAIAIYSLCKAVTSDPVNSDWATNWNYEDYNK